MWCVPARLPTPEEAHADKLHLWDRITAPGTQGDGPQALLKRARTATTQRTLLWGLLMLSLWWVWPWSPVWLHLLWGGACLVLGWCSVRACWWTLRHGGSLRMVRQHVELWKLVVARFEAIVLHVRRAETLQRGFALGGGGNAGFYDRECTLGSRTVLGRVLYQMLVPQVQEMRALLLQNEELDHATNTQTGTSSVEMRRLLQLWFPCKQLACDLLGTILSSRELSDSAGGFCFPRIIPPLPLTPS